MSLAYQVYSESEALRLRYSILKPGIYDALIIKSEDKTSSNGYPMMALQLQVFDKDGNSHEVRDWLVFMPQMMWKVIHFSSSCGVLDLYNEGKLCSAEVKGKNLRVQIVEEVGQEIPFDKLSGKPPGSRYPNRNRVEDYIKRSAQKVQHTAPEKVEELNDDVPF